jgi:5-oxoprolinase (ATP-hydrolysing)
MKYSSTTNSGNSLGIHIILVALVVIIHLFYQNTSSSFGVSSFHLHPTLKFRPTTQPHRDHMTDPYIGTVTETTTSTSTTMTMTNNDSKFHFAIDRGGTFTDIYCTLPNGRGEIVTKLLSEDPSHYNDAPTEGIRRILQQYDHDGTTTTTTSSNIDYSRGHPVSTTNIGSIRMGTTVATNALLERNGSRMALLITSGFTDLLEIGNQSRPNIFDLKCTKPSLLYECVVPIHERIVLKQYTPPQYGELYEEHVGVTGEVIQIVEPLDVHKVQESLEQLRANGIKAIAICCMHAYIYPQHEIIIGQMAEAMNYFDYIAMSHQVMPMIKLVSRSHTTTAAAYLTPKIMNYLHSFIQGFDENLLTNVALSFMKSDGGLTPHDNFGGHQAILSGPAGGVVGYAKTAYHRSSMHGSNNAQPQPVIGYVVRIHALPISCLFHDKSNFQCFRT